MKKQKNTIILTMHTYEEFFSEYNENILSENLSNYIVSQTLGVSVNEKIELLIETSCDLTEEQKETIKKAIQNNYKIDSKENKMNIHFDNIKTLFLFVIGLILLILANTFESLEQYILSELILIGGWVSIWEAIYSILFVDTKLKFHLKRLKQLIRMDIKFQKKQ